ncbi:MAG: amidohydrolase [candidate division KSB1 bacterium]
MPSRFIILAGRCLVVFLLFSFTAFAQSRTSSSKSHDRVRSQSAALYAELEKLYLHLHQNPELSFYEEKSAARLTQELRACGFEMTTGVGGHGIVGVLRNGKGPTVLVRADMDALPVTENTGLAYASTVRVHDGAGKEVGVMHACGHDVHMTVFAGTARVLAQMKEHWQGTLVFIGQPAEERGGGARKMLADGLYTRFPVPDYALALHVSATLEAGKIEHCAGYALANVNSVDLTIRGVGGHGAYPHTTKDPIVIAAQTILALQTIVSRETKPIAPAVVTVGSIHGGTKHNIISDEVKLELTLRSYSDEVREHTIAAIRRIANGIAQAAGVPEDRMPLVQVANEFTPSTYNDPQLVQRLVPAFERMLGKENVIASEPVMGGEDFGEYGRTKEKVPICIFWLGVIAPEKVAASRAHGVTLPSLHSSQFAPLLEPSIKTGVQAMSAAVLELLGR